MHYCIKFHVAVLEHEFLVFLEHHSHRYKTSTPTRSDPNNTSKSNGIFLKGSEVEGMDVGMQFDDLLFLFIHCCFFFHFFYMVTRRNIHFFYICEFLEMCLCSSKEIWIDPILNEVCPGLLARNCC